MKNHRVIDIFVKLSVFSPTFKIINITSRMVYRMVIIILLQFMLKNKKDNLSAFKILLVIDEVLSILFVI